MFKIIKKTLILIVSNLLVILLYALGLYSFQEKFYIFPDSEYVSPKKAGVPGFKEIFIRADDGILIRTWFTKGNDDKPLVLFFHGNVAQNAEFAPELIDYIREGFGIMMMEYRQFGGSDGKFTQENIYMDAKTSFDYLKSNFGKRDIVVMGYSMGSAPASYLAFSRNPLKVVLISPFYSLKHLVGEKDVFLAENLIKNEMPNYKFIQNYEGKLLIIHGDKDTLVPLHHGKNLYDKAQKSERQLIVLKDIGHNEIFFDTKSKGHKKIINWIYNKDTYNL